MPEAPATVTIPNVELVRTGTWAASTGVTTIGLEDLEAMLAASADPEVDDGPVKLGHTGALSNLGDSEPALGWVHPTAVRDNGDGTHTLLGNLVDVPAGLKDTLLAAYKRRSVEIAWAVKTPSGSTYRAALTGLALLGVAPPAVKGLADIAALFQPAKTAATAAADLGAASYTALALWDSPAGAVEVDWRQRVADQLRWARQSAAELAALVGLEGLQAVFDALDAMAARADSRNFSDSGPDHGTRTTTPEGSMTTMDIAKLREIFGLGDDVPDDQVEAKLTELKTRTDELEAAGKGEGAAGDGTEAGAGEQQPAALSADTVKALKDAGLTVITDAAFAELQAGAQAGAQAATQLTADRRRGILDAAQRAGKFGGGEQAKTTRAKFAALLDSDEAGTVALLDTLPALAPVTELGSDDPGTPDGTFLTEDQIDQELARFFGEPAGS